MTEFGRDYAWQATYLPHVKRLLGEALLREGDAVEDKEQATDLIVLKLDAVRVGCRIRRVEYFDRYGGEFTIRSWRASGAKTELAKILEGWGDYLFYGFASESTTGRLCAAALISLDWFRWWYADCRNAPPHRVITNRDGHSAGIAFALSDLPNAAVVARWGRRPVGVLV